MSDTLRNTSSDIKGIDKVFYLFDKLHEDIKSLEWGKSKVVECPYCKGKMIMSRSNYNGHLYINCADCKFRLIQ